MKEKKKEFGVRDKFGYLMGDVGNDFTFLFASTYVMIFYSKVMGIDTAIIGTMFLLARLIDAVTDLGMGRIVDKSKGNENGKFKPWILRMCGPVAFASFLMYQSSLAGAPQAVKIVYMFVTYILWGSVFYTSINIPYGSMASVISDDPKHRSSLSVFRSMGSSIAGILINVIAPLVIYYKDENDNELVSGKNFTILAGVFSVCAIISYLVCYYNVTERVKYKAEKKEKIKIWVVLKEVVASRALLGVILSAVLLIFAQLLGQSVNNYVFTDYYKSAKAVSIFSALALPAMFILAAVSTKLSVKFGKKECGIVGMFFSAGFYLLAGVLHFENVALFIAFLFIAMLGMYFLLMQCYAMVTDVIDDKEVRTGSRDDGTVYGVYSFTRKVGQAIAGALGGWLLAAIGYEENAAAQTESVKTGLYNIATFGPGIIYLLCALVLLFIYPLGKKEVESNAAKLQEKRDKNM